MHTRARPWAQRSRGFGGQRGEQTVDVQREREHGLDPKLSAVCPNTGSNH